MSEGRAARRVAAGLAGAGLAALVMACGPRGDSTGPSLVQPIVPRVVAVVRADGVVLKAQHLQDAQQIEGIVHWVPDTVWYDSFDRGPWWFSSSEWEYVFEPNRGEMYFGVWRGERLSGDGIVGRIRFRAAATLLGLRVWVDGQPVEATFEDRRSEHDDGVLTLVPGDGATRGVQGTRTNHAWFILPAPVSEK